MSLLLLHLLQIIERTNISLRMYDISKFLNLLYLLHLIQQVWFIYIFGKLIGTILICNQSVFFPYI